MADFDMSELDKGWLAAAEPPLPETQRSPHGDHGEYGVPDRPSYHGMVPTTDRPRSALEEAFWVQYDGRMPVIGFGELPDGSPYALVPKDMLTLLRSRKTT